MRSQKIEKRDMRRLGYLLLIPLLTMASCVKEPAGNDPNTLPNVPEGMVRIGLYTSSGDYQTPATRAANYEDLDEDTMPWVFVFLGNDDDARFVEVKQAEQLDATKSVLLKQQSSAVRILVVANAPANFYKSLSEPNAAFEEAELKAALTGKKFDEAVNGILNTAKLSADQATVPYDGEYLPMTGIADLLYGITAGTTIGTSGSEVPLTRVVAKVTVTNSAAGFKLSTASMAEAKEYGRLYRATAVTDLTNIGKINYKEDIVEATGTAGNGNTTENPIYIYEAAEGETSVIVKGKYGDIEGYYRLAFKSKTDVEIMPVKRNKHYEFEITKVEGPGYATFALAVASEPSNNITYKIDVTDQSSHDIIDNGQYYLGVSNSEFIVYADGKLTDLLALTVRTDATHSHGIATNKIAVESADAGSLYVSTTAANPPTTATTNEAKINIDGTLTDIKISTTSANFTTGKIIITLGNLRKEITVTRRAPLGWQAGATQIPGKFAAAKFEAQESWLSMSGDGTTQESGVEMKYPNGAGSFYLMTKSYLVAGYVETNPVRKKGEIFLYRHNNDGRVKLHIEQKGRTSSPANAGIIGYDPDNDKLTIDGTGFALLFKFGSVVGILPGVDHDKWSIDDVAFNPSDINITTNNYTLVPYARAAYPSDQNLVKTEGLGDPCKLVGLTMKDIRTDGKTDNNELRTPTGNPLENTNVTDSYGRVYAAGKGTPTKDGEVLSYATIWNGSFNTSTVTFKVGSAAAAGYGGVDMTVRWHGERWGTAFGDYARGETNLGMLNGSSNGHHREWTRSLRSDGMGIATFYRPEYVQMNAAAEVTDAYVVRCLRTSL